MSEPLTAEHLATMEQAARRFAGAYFGTSGSLAGFVILLLRERERLAQEIAMLRARLDK
jgi:hypothetical protein